MSNILLIETATEVCSAAIAADGVVIALEEDADCSNHAARLTLLIDACTRTAAISLAELDAVAISRGPGAYTSLRVGVSVAKGICYALDKPLIAVDTLQALAWASLEDYRLQLAGAGFQSAAGGESVPHSVILLPMLDARRQEVWLAAYGTDLQLQAPVQPLILENNLFEIWLREQAFSGEIDMLILSGNGAKKLTNVRNTQNTVVTYVEKCSSAHLAALSKAFFQRNDFQDISYFEPMYMKPPNITTPSKTPF